MPFSIITGVMVGGRTYDVNAATSHRTFQFRGAPLPHRSQILFQDVVPFKGGRSFCYCPRLLCRLTAGHAEA